MRGQLAPPPSLPPGATAATTEAPWCRCHRAPTQPVAEPYGPPRSFADLYECLCPQSDSNRPFTDLKNGSEATRHQRERIVTRRQSACKTTNLRIAGPNAVRPTVRIQIALVGRCHHRRATRWSGSRSRRASDLETSPNRSRPRQRTSRCPASRFTSNRRFGAKPEYPIPSFSWAVLRAPLRLVPGNNRAAAVQPPSSEAVPA
ncbi:MAG: hypothetical protein QOF15_1244 [Mycobacterium sp.]|nr:hypothetical protein [Mycobacterium sp.]